MLIVNADDFGASSSATEASATAFAAGVITSCSAMVWMRDSDRASRLAQELGLPVGLHLNLTVPFDGADVPSAAQERQSRLTETFDRASWFTTGSKRPTRRLLEDAVRDQVEQFSASFGVPTHLDGHHHIHVRDEVLEVLPPGIVIRMIVRDPARVDEPASMRERRLHERFTAPSLTLAFERLHPALEGVGLQVLERARSECIEVMTHPLQEGQLDALLSPAWRVTLARLPVGSFDALSAKV